MAVIRAQPAASTAHLLTWQEFRSTTQASFLFSTNTALLQKIENTSHSLPVFLFLFCSFPTISFLVFSGCYNQTAWTGRLVNSRNFLLTVLEVDNSKIKADLVSGGGFLVHSFFLAMSSHTTKSLPHGIPLLMAITLRMGFNIWNWKGHKHSDIDCCGLGEVWCPKSSCVQIQSLPWKERGQKVGLILMFTHGAFGKWLE